ncbi:hypothetical protein ACLOAU_19110 [Niabella sp. CJ426]|uniref:hypothetical protein n=1 Tax=Niabella sp. CJ426 TaxID=3393740 RepID=UPI003CFD8245
MKLNTILRLLLVMTGFATLHTACNKSEKNVLESPENISHPEAKARKVLLVVLDGGVGAEIKKIAPPNIMDATEHAIFSWDAIVSHKQANPVTKQMGWATLLTGVMQDKHHVASSAADNHFSDYPTLFTKLKQLNPQLRTVALSTSAEISSVYAKDATEKKSFSADEAVNGAALEELGSQNPDLLVVGFKGAEDAGVASSYTAASPAYKDAILTIDGYIAKMIQAIQTRPGFNQEDWMIILTSSKGSDSYDASKPWTAYEDERYNNFFVCFNPRFSYSLHEKPLVFPHYGATMSYQIGDDSKPNSYAALNANNFLDLSTSGDYTIQFKIKAAPGNDYAWPSFFGKMQQFNESSSGWICFLQDDFWVFSAAGTSGTGGRMQAKGGKVSDGEWHTCSMVIKGAGSGRSVAVFTDGVLNSTGTLGARNITTAEPFRIGYRPGNNYGSDWSPAYLLVTDISVYKKAQSNAYIGSNYCATTPDLADADLLTYWSCRSISGSAGNTYFADNTGMNNLYLKQSNITSFSDISLLVCSTVDDEAYKLVPSSMDVASQVYSWLRYPVSPEWKLDGQIWVPKYQDVQ